MRRWHVLCVSLASTCIISVVLCVLYRRRRVESSCRKRNNTSAQPLRPLLDISCYSIVILTDELECEEYFTEKIGGRHQFIGLDCEWVSENYRKNHHMDNDGNNTFSPVALLQLAFPNKECALVRICNMENVASSLETLLRDRSVMKFGVGISNDVSRLATGFNLTVDGTVDLRNLAVRCGIRQNCSLAGLTNQIVGRSLVKSKDITCSNWEREELTLQQIQYAASDAIAALLILSGLIGCKLSNKRNQEVLSSITFPNSEQQLVNLDLLMQEDGISCARSLCQGLVGREYKQLLKGNIPLTESYRNNEPRRTSAYSVRKTPLYYNCQLIAPDGTLLSTVDQKKVEWYISKGLGVLVREDPPTVQLKFEPSGKPNKDREYYLTEKENLCVVCGKDDSYIKKNVIPHEYRKHFPKEMKEHISHDVLLLCVSCHQLSDSFDRFIRRELAIEYGVPIDAGAQKFREDPDKIRRRSLARALTEQRQLPEKRKLEILETLADYFKCETSDITNEMLQQLVKSETRLLNDDFVSHGELVIKEVLQRGELLQFQKKWRVHFLESMKPRFLPKLWSVDHNPRS